ncbi:MAG TPA: ABC transporter permease [Acidimicrobiia bacterium]|jgi:osmoprotectant transport system permease protein
MGDAVEPAEGGVVIDFLGEVAGWFADPANWTGNRGVPNLLLAHVSLSAVAVAAAALISLPSAIYLGHVRRGGFLAVSLVNIGRALPSFGIVGVMYPVTLAFALTRSPLGYWATLIAMILLAMPPMFVNAYTAIRDVDPALTEAARGMGMREGQVVRRLELPLGLPLIMAGIRSAAVAVVATVTLGAWVGYGTLGTYIFVGFAQGDEVLIFAGGLLVAMLAVVTELGLGWVERRTDQTHHGRRRQGARPLAISDEVVATRP